MTFWILPISCIPIPQSTVILIQPHGLNAIHVTKLLTEYTKTVNLKIGNHTKFMVPDKLHHPTSLNSNNPFSDNWEGDIRILPYEPSSEENAMEQLDEFIDTQITLDTLILQTSPTYHDLPETLWELALKLRGRDNNGGIDGTDKHAKEALSYFGEKTHKGESFQQHAMHCILHCCYNCSN